MSPFMRVMPQIILLVLLAIGVAVLLRVQRSLKQAAGETPQERHDSAATAQQFVGISGIHDDLIEVDPRHYRAVIAVEGVNFYLKSEVEQVRMQDGYRQLLDSIQCPAFQIAATSVRVDPQRLMRTMRERVETMPDAIKSYGREVIAQTRQWVEERAPLRKAFYLVLCWDMEDPRRVLRPEAALVEAQEFLDNQVSVVLEGLNTIGLKAWRLTNSELVEMLFQTFNRDRAKYTSAQDMEAAGVYNVVVSSPRVGIKHSVLHPAEEDAVDSAAKPESPVHVFNRRSAD